MSTFNLGGLTEDINERAFGIDFWTQALLANNTMAMIGQYGEIIPNMKQDTYKMPLLDTPITLTDTGCGDTAGPDPIVTQRTLAMVGIKAAGEFCPHELEPYFLADHIPAGQNYENFQPLQAAIVNRISSEIAKKMAIFPWYGPTGTDTATYTTSWMDQLLAATNIVVGSTTINNGGSNGTDTQGAFNVVQALIGKFLANADTAGEVYQDDAIVVAMSPNAVNLYFQNYRTLFGDHNVTPSYDSLANGVALGGWYHPGTRVKVVIQNALGIGGEVVAFRRGNLVLGVDLISDTTGIRLWYSQDDDLIKWRMKAKIGTGIRSITNANTPATVAPNVVYWGPAS